MNKRINNKFIELVSCLVDHINILIRVDWTNLLVLFKQKVYEKGKY